MMRSMFSAISGLKNHQTFMDVVGNNIANVNTTGFKQSRVTFQDILSQTVRGASGPQGGRGGVNPEQVGLGVLISGIDTIQTQGTLQSTGKQTDMAIQGDGYFVMSDSKQNFFSRDGAFDLGTDGTLVNPSSGLHVMGWQANPLTGVIDTSVPPTNVSVPIGAGMTGKASTSLTVTGNLDSNNAGGAANGVVLSATAYDAQGNAVPITLTAVKSATPDNWPNPAGRGQMAQGFREDSNVDLAQQFTNMIMAERGFQANSRVITTSDEILQDLVNLKH